MRTILIVEPERDSEPLTALLNRRGFSARVVDGGGKALAVLTTEGPVDMVIMELRLPDMDGLDLLAAIKRNWPSLPVLVMTAWGSIESYLHAVNMGVVEYLNKPIMARELSSIVRNVFHEPPTPIDTA